MAQQELKVISASRRTDMVAGDPDKLTRLLAEKYPPENVHSLVLWTKNAYNILGYEELRHQLEKYDQVFVHYSITGLGGTLLEPRVPDFQTAFSYIPALIDFIKSPSRLRIRFDPVVHFKLQDGTIVCNLTYFEKFAPVFAKYNIKDVSVSWVQIYDKVYKRLNQYKIAPINISHEQWQEEADWLQKIADDNNITLHGCCVPGWPRSRCIDGFLLNMLHPKGYKATTRRAKGQRAECGCTESRDIGWYHACPHGCIYCYGNPHKYFCKV